jgi:hypothetical protein
MMADQYKQSMINVADQANQGVSILEELIFDEPQKLLAYVKLWQFYRTQATFEPLKSENLALSTEIAEKLTFHFSDLSATMSPSKNKGKP